MSLSLLVTSYRKLLLQTNFTDTSKFLPKHGHRKQDLNHICWSWHRWTRHWFKVCAHHARNSRFDEGEVGAEVL